MYSKFYLLRRWVFVFFERIRRKIKGIRSLEPFDIDTETPIRTFYEGPVFDPLGIRPGLMAKDEIPACGLHPDENIIPPEEILGKKIVLQIDPVRSHFGDALNMIDAPDEKKVDPRFPPFGWSGESLVGGYAMTVSKVSGQVAMYFDTEVKDGFVSFKLHHSGRVLGTDSVLTSPDGYDLASTGNLIVDSRPISHGRLELATGRLYDFHYNVEFFNSAISLLMDTNPKLPAPPLLFPGVPGGGHAIGHLRYESESREFTLSVYALMFLPLDADAEGEAIRMPASKSGALHKEAFLARNTSLHPYINMVASQHTETRRDSGDVQAKNVEWLRPYEDCVTNLVSIPPMANFGDDFQLHSPNLGGSAYGITPNFGDVRIQFGHITDGFVPYNISFRTGCAPFEKRLDGLMKVLPPGSKPGLIGMRGYLDFPKMRYVQDNLSLTSDPQKIAIGVADLHKPDCSHELVLRKFFFLSVLQNLIVAEPRTPTDSFAFVAKAKVTRTPSGHLLYEANGSINIPYPTGYRWPYPNGRGMVIESKSYLTPFVNVFAVEAKAFSEVAQIEGNHVSHRVKRGKANSVEVRYSSNADTKTQWVIDIDKRRFTGHSTKPARVMDDLGDHRSVLIAEIEIVSPVRQHACIYIVQGVNSIDVTCFSTREDLDFWYE